MIYRELVKEGNNLCFDVGANIGNRTKMFLDVGYKKVIAFEPQKKCVENLIQLFKNDNRVIIIDKALSDEEKVETIFISNADTISSMSRQFIEEVKKERFKEYRWNLYDNIQTTTLDKMIEKFGRPDFLKIDVEGYELNVLKGLSTPINNISFEYTPELHNQSMLCIEVLENISDYVYNFSLGESLKYSFDHWISKRELDNSLKLLKGMKDSNNNFVFGDIYAKKIKN